MSTVIDQMAAAATERMAQHINRSAGQHLRAMAKSAPKTTRPFEVCEHPGTDCTGACAKQGGNIWYAEPEPFFYADSTAHRVAFVITTIISLVAVVALGLHLYLRFFN